MYNTVYFLQHQAIPREEWLALGCVQKYPMAQFDVLS